MNYAIRKISNGEHKEINKNFTLNLNRYCSDTSTLYFDVEGEEIPFLMNFTTFFNIMNEQIQNGLLEKMDYNDGIISVTIRDGNTIKNYNYDFKINEFSNYPYNSNNLDYLKNALFRIISMYKENPNSSVSSEQKYIWFIYDILDGDRNTNIDDTNELLRIFEVYNSHKEEFLEVLLNNVVFYDNDGNILEYNEKIRNRKLELIRHDVYMQMEAAILLFASQNNSIELYQKYLESAYIPRREIVYSKVDENGNEIESVKETEEKSKFSLIEQGISKLKRLVKK